VCETPCQNKTWGEKAQFSGEPRFPSFAEQVLASLALLVVRNTTSLKIQQKYSEIVGGTLTLKKTCNQTLIKKKWIWTFIGFKNVQKCFLWEKFWKCVFFKGPLRRQCKSFKRKVKNTLLRKLFGHFPKNLVWTFLILRPLVQLCVRWCNFASVGAIPASVGATLRPLVQFLCPLVQICVCWFGLG
jgi:hypothetical protein